jgi:prepilin-type N-terminal cleavage/methylation domain-containing protein
MKRHVQRRGRRGFTMIELMLVIVIMLLTTTLAIPAFIKSLRGARLRTSARTVVMMHRHARAMAVLQQKQVAVLYDVQKNEIEIVWLSGSRTTDAQAMFLEERADRVLTAEPEPADAEAVAAPPPNVESEMIRPLEDGIRIVDFKSDREDQSVEGIHWMNYYPNGMCDRYTMKLMDEKERTVEVDVDNLSGRVMVKEAK